MRGDGRSTLRCPKHLKKFVIAGAPHTTNWDFVFFTGATHEEGVRPNFMGKHTLFNGIMKNFMARHGAASRSTATKKANVTQQVAAEFAARDELALVIATEGTRKSDGKWRSGFLPHCPRRQCADRPRLCR